MDLRDRRRPDRLGIDIFEQFGRRLVQAVIDFLINPLEPFGRQRILQGQQIVRRFLANQIGAGGERLPQLDRGRADFAKGTGIIGDLRLDRPQPRNPAQPLHLWRGVAILLDPAQRAVTRQYAAPSEQAENMGCGTGHRLLDVSLWMRVMPAQARIHRLPMIITASVMAHRPRGGDEME